MRRIDTLILHHTDGEGTGEQIKNYHVNIKNWSDIFYHYVIEKDGSIFKGRPINRNSHSERQTAIEIAVVGRLHENRILPKQEETLENLIDDLTYQFDINIFKNHRDIEPTICPGNIDIYDYIMDSPAVLTDEFKNKINIELTKQLADRVGKLEKQVERLTNEREDTSHYIHNQIMPAILLIEKIKKLIK